MSSKRVKSCYWDFVYNNETDESSETLKNLLTQWDIIVDAAYQHEVAPTTGMRHLQGWIKLDKRQYKSYLIRSRLNEGIWENKLSFRPARNPKALMDYVKKNQDGAHGFWCKSLEQKQKEEKTLLDYQWQLVKEADEKYIIDLSIPLEEYDDEIDTENNIYSHNESLVDPLIDTATKELQQEVDISKKSDDGQAIIYSGLSALSYRDTINGDNHLTLDNLLKRIDQLKASSRRHPSGYQNL